MSTQRIYIRNFDKPDVEIDADEAIIFERNGAAIRVYFDPAGELKISADERVSISPEASNVFVVRPADPLSRIVARRVRKTIGRDPRELSTADVMALVEAALR